LDVRNLKEIAHVWRICLRTAGGWRADQPAHARRPLHTVRSAVDTHDIANRRTTAYITLLHKLISWFLYFVKCTYWTALHRIHSLTGIVVN